MCVVSPPTAPILSHTHSDKWGVCVLHKLIAPSPTHTQSTHTHTHTHTDTRPHTRQERSSFCTDEDARLAAHLAPSTATSPQHPHATDRRATDSQPDSQTARQTARHTTRPTHVCKGHGRQTQRGGGPSTQSVISRTQAARQLDSQTDIGPDPHTRQTLRPSRSHMGGERGERCRTASGQPGSKQNPTPTRPTRTSHTCKGFREAVGGYTSPPFYVFFVLYVTPAPRLSPLQFHLPSATNHTHPHHRPGSQTHDRQTDRHTTDRHTTDRRPTHTQTDTLCRTARQMPQGQLALGGGGLGGQTGHKCMNASTLTQMAGRQHVSHTNRGHSIQSTQHRDALPSPHTPPAEWGKAFVCLSVYIHLADPN